jgi:hypothetical protein
MWFLVVAMLVTLALSTVGSAQEYPKVANLTPFSAEAKFMSLPGYLRWLVYLDRHVWISRSEAAAAVQEQMGGM